MTTSSSRRAAVLLLVSLFVPCVLRAQVTATKPITVKAPKPKMEKFKGEVLHMTRQAITVRSRENNTIVRTFTYGEKLAPKMARRMEENKMFQHGDRVELRFAAGSDVAVKLKGKASKPR